MTTLTAYTADTAPETAKPGLKDAIARSVSRRGRRQRSTDAPYRISSVIEPKLGTRAMRGGAVAFAVVAALLAWNAAAAQTSSAQTNGQASSVWPAPVGHRQPTAKDVPRGLQDNYGVRSLEDEAVDRKLRICRDC